MGFTRPTTPYPIRLRSRNNDSDRGQDCLAQTQDAEESLGRQPARDASVVKRFK